MQSRSNHKLLAAVAAVTLATLISLVLAEMIVRIFAPQNLSGSWLAHAPGGYWVNRANSTAVQRYGSHSVPLRFNSRHMRGDEPPASGWKVLCLGDSFTFGWLLPESETFVNKIEAAARNEFAPSTITFLNGGTGGWGAAQYTGFYERFCDDVDARAVIVFLNFDDAVRSPQSGPYVWSDATHTTITTAPDEWNRDHVRDAMQAIPGYQWLLEHSHLVQLVRRTFLDSLRRKAPAALSAPQAEECVAFTKIVFRRLKELCAARGAALFVVAIGCGDAVQAQAPEHWTEPDRSFALQAPAFFASLQVPFTDLSPEMSSAMGAGFREFFVPGDVHFNEKGTSLFARTAWPWLRDRLRDVIQAAPKKPTHE